MTGSDIISGPVHRSRPASAHADRGEQRRRDLAAVEREQARLTEAVATTGPIQVVVERLRTTEAKRRALVAELERSRHARPNRSWREVEQRMRNGFADWRARLRGDVVADVREAFRKLLTAPIRFTPGVERGYRVIRFEGRIGLAAILGGELVTNLASPTGLSPSGHAKCRAKSGPQRIQEIVGLLD